MSQSDGREFSNTKIQILQFESLPKTLNLQANYKMLVQLSPWNWIRSNNFLVSIPHVTQTSDIEETIN